jgi:acetyl esterase/lipase
MPNIRIDTDVVATSVGGRDLKVDIFHPGENANGLGILFLPGGGFRIANKAGLHERYAKRMAEKGYVFIATEYRVMDEAPWPAQIQDANAFIRWMRANSKDLAIDPDRIVLGGASAGGNLSLLAAGTPGVAEFEGDGGNAGVSSAVAAVIGVYPVTDVTGRGEDEGREKLYGKNPSEAMLKAASPVYQVTSSYPPTMLVHGTADTTVDYSNSMRMFQALEDAGVPVDIHLYAGQEHIFDREPMFADAVSDAMALFIERYVPAATRAFP